MSGQTNHKLNPLANEFTPRDLRSTENLPAPSTVMAENKERIKRSPLFGNSLVGRAGLLREIGASYDHGAVTSAWAENLRHRYALQFHSISPDDKDYRRIHKFTSTIYDEGSRKIIAVADLCVGGRMQSSMSYLPLFPSQ